MEYTIDDLWEKIRRFDSSYDCYNDRKIFNDHEFWMLAMIEKGFDTQAKLCSTLFFPKQTVNSSLKKFIKMGYIEPFPAKEKKIKKIVFTSLGKEYIEKQVRPVLGKEKRMWDSLSWKDKKKLFDLLDDMTKHMNKDD